MRFRIDLKIFVFFILFYFTKQIEIYALIMIFSILHEIGHLLAGLIIGMKAEKIEIMPFGVSICFKINPSDYNKKIKNGNKMQLKKMIIAIAGPLTNFVIIMLALNIKIREEIIYTNLLLMLFNLLPIYPLDGGRIVKCMLHILYGKKKSEKFIIIISKINIMILTFIASIMILYVKNIAIVIIIVFLWYLVIKEEIIYNKRKEIYKKILENHLI